MAERKFMLECDVCDSQYQFGPHRYDGKYIAAYGIKVCMGCYEGNWDGWAPQFDERVTKNLRAAGKALPARNANGLLPRDG